MRGRLFKTHLQPKQANQKKKISKRPKLTKEFQTGLNERRRAAYLSYKNAIQSLLSGLEKDIERVAIENRKSIKKVSQDVQMARQVY